MAGGAGIFRAAAFCCALHPAMAAALPGLPPPGSALPATEAIQRAIDRASAAGGGAVRIPAGKYVTGGLLLKSGVSLELDEGATLLGSTNVADYAATRNHALVFAEGARDIAIRGKGTIDGRGGHFPFGVNRPYLVELSFCTNVVIEGPRLRCGGTWTLHPRDCDGVTVRDVKIWSHVANCNDGIDLSSRNVLIENCEVDVDDDALVFKTKRHDMRVENVRVRNCVLSSSCNFIKFGTESHGVVRNVEISDVRLVPTKTHSRWDWRIDTPGVTNYFTGLSGIALQSVDGGLLENVVIRNVSGSGMQTPVSVRLGRRNESRRGESGAIRNILIENFRAEATSRIACSVTGVKGLRPRDIVFRNLDLKLMSGGTRLDVLSPVPEKEASYPENRMFDGMALPAWGFYLRHADAISFENVKLTFSPGREERPAIFADDANFTFDSRCSFRQNDGPYPPVMRPTAADLERAERTRRASMRRSDAYFAMPAAFRGERPPLLVLCGFKYDSSLQARVDGILARGWAALVPDATDAKGIYRAIDDVAGKCDPMRFYLKADDSAVAARLMADRPEFWAAVAVCNPAKGNADLRQVKGVAVDLATGIAHPKIREALAAFNELAKPEDRLTQAEIDAAVDDGIVPAGREWKSTDDDFFPPLRTVMFRIQSGRIRLTVCRNKGVNTWMPAIKWLDGNSRPSGRKNAKIACGRKGVSSRDYAVEWERSVMGGIRRGDTVYVCFGEADRRAGIAAHEEFRNNLRRYVCDIRYHGGVPVLCAPKRPGLEEYAGSVRSLAEDMDVKVLER